MDNNQNNGYYDRSEEMGSHQTNMPPLGANVLHPTTGLATASLVCGICGIVFSCCCSIGIIPAVIAIILALVDRRQTAGFSGTALGGLICGIIGALLSILVIVAWVSSVNAVMDMMSDPVFSSEFESIFESMYGSSI